jgi:hypothetical protein
MRAVITSSVTFLFAVGLIFFYPELSLNPGQTSSAHNFIHKDCLKCHTIITGSVNSKCISCHPVNDIDIKKTNGELIDSKNKIKFHGQLLKKDCMACHTEHNVINGKTTGKFSHELLEIELKYKCSLCHFNKPADNLHKVVNAECGICHNTNIWKTDNFNHSVIKAEELSNCIICHNQNIPVDELHSGISAECGVCHSTNKWKPADFQHDKYFAFDKHHPNDCRTCHPSGYKTYTCYGCHEHSPSKIREEHIEEGISDFNDCISCHRSGDEHGSENERKGRDKESKKDRNKEEDDDD